MDPVRLARELIGFDTTNPPGHEEDALRHLASILAPAGFSVVLDTFAKEAPGRASLVARLRRPDRTPGPAFCLAGHIDTVPVGEAAWRHAPFAGEIDAGKLYGRGASDMKGGIAAMCSAALELARGGFDRELALYVFGGEESGCQGSFHVAADPDLLGEPSVVVVTEPTHNRPLVGHKGALWLRCEASGRTAHGSMPELGDNALIKAVDAIGRIRDLAFPVTPHPHLGLMTMSVNTLHAGQNINSVPDLATWTIDIRSIPGQSNAALVEQVASAAGSGVVVEVLLDIPPVWTEPDHPWVSRAFTVLEPHLDRPPGIETVQFFTDAAALRSALPETPILILGPGDPGLAHQTDEYCDTDQILTATAMYRDLAEDWRTA